jgi:hypothetical protein
MGNAVSLLVIAGLQPLQFGCRDADQAPFAGWLHGMQAAALDPSADGGAADLQLGRRLY